MDYANWKVTDLKDKLRELGHPVSGKKAELVDRLQNLQGPSSSNAGRLVIDAKTTSASASKTSDFNSMTIPQLKDELTKYHLPVTGKRKEELVQRLNSYLECQLTGRIDFDFIGTRPIELLMVAEKPSMAQELSNMLAQRGGITRSSCSNNAIPVFQFRMMFHGYRANVRMTSTLGHIHKLDFGPKVQRNQAEELFEAEVATSEANPEKRIPKMLAEIAKGSDALVLWLDCDLEGEAICFEVIDCVKKVIRPPPSNNVMDVIYRAKFSSSDQALTAIDNLIKPNFRYHLAALAKHDLDLRIGVAFSRYQTFVLRRAFPDRDIDHISFGPCQTPCLHFCVEQQEKVQSYNPTSKYHIKITLDFFDIEITSDPFNDEQEAYKLFQKLKDEHQCKVVSVERKSHVEEPPKGLNTVELLKDASKRYGIGPSEAMSAAEYLYTSGFISYPRTETTKYPKTLDLKDKKAKLRQMLPSFPAMQFMPVAPSIRGRRLDSDDEEPMDWETIVEKDEVYERGVDKGDHCPIVPTGKAVTRSLSDVQKLIYELVCRRFFASWMPEQRFHTVDTVFSAADVRFKRRIQEVDDYGFAKLLPWEKAKLTKDIPSGIIVKGKEIKIKNMIITTSKSTAPSLISESDLIEKMEMHSIGTDASISSHITNIQRRKYVQLQDEEKRTLMPTKLGVQLIKSYRECIPKLVETSLRAEFEDQIMKIAKGEREYDDARRVILDAFKEQFKIFKNNFHKYTKNFEGCFEIKTEGIYGRKGYQSNQNNFNQQPSSSVNNRKVIHASRHNYNSDQGVRPAPIMKPDKPISQYPQKPFRDAYDRRETVATKRSPVKRSLARVESFEESIKRLRL